MFRLLCVLGLASLAWGESGDDDSVFTLEHDLGQGAFSLRGRVRLPGVRHKEPEVLSQEELDSAEIDSLISQDRHGIYRLKVKSRKAADNSTDVMGYMNARKLLSSPMNDDALTVYYDDVMTIYYDDVGNIISISVRPQSKSDDGDSANFNTILLAQFPSQGPVPDTAGFLNKIRDEKIKKEKAEKEPKSFLGKYWMYIVPVVLYMMVSSAGQQQQQGG